MYYFVIVKHLIYLTTPVCEEGYRSVVRNTIQYIEQNICDLTIHSLQLHEFDDLLDVFVIQTAKGCYLNVSVA